MIGIPQGFHEPVPNLADVGDELAELAVGQIRLRRHERAQADGRPAFADRLGDALVADRSLPLRVREVAWRGSSAGPPGPSPRPARRGRSRSASRRRSGRALREEAGEVPAAERGEPASASASERAAPHGLRSPVAGAARERPKGQRATDSGQAPGRIGHAPRGDRGGRRRRPVRPGDAVRGVRERAARGRRRGYAFACAARARTSTRARFRIEATLRARRARARRHDRPARHRRRRARRCPRVCCAPCAAPRRAARASPRSAAARSCSRRPDCSTAGARPRTGWRHRELARRYPKIRVEPDVLYVDEGQVLTSAGAAAALDLCLHMVRRDYGSAVAVEPRRARR